MKILIIILVLLLTGCGRNSFDRALMLSERKISHLSGLETKFYWKEVIILEENGDMVKVEGTSYFDNPVWISKNMGFIRLKK